MHRLIIGVGVHVKKDVLEEIGVADEVGEVEALVKGKPIGGRSVNCCSVECVDGMVGLVHI